MSSKECKGDKVFRNGKCRKPLKPCNTNQERNPETGRCKLKAGASKRRTGKRLTKRLREKLKEEIRIGALKPKKGTFVERSTLPLQKHQMDFANSLIDKPIHGAIAIHGVGTGKTLTAVATAEKFLEEYPRENVVVVTPASLLLGFKEELYKFDPAIEKDKRYKF